MRKFAVVFSLLGAVVLMSSLQLEEGDCAPSDGSRKSAGPPSCYSGEPPMNMTCGISGCHGDAPLNSGSANVMLYLGGADTGYMPGQNYVVTVSIRKPGFARGGFQLVALRNDDNTTTPGVISQTENVRTQLINAANPHSGGCATQNKTWIEHTANGIDDIAGDSIKWTFNWQAPSNYKGDVTFYLCAVDANKDLDNTGDFVFTRTKTIASLVTSVQDENIFEEVSLFPNPVSGKLHLNFGSFKVQEGDKVLVVNSLGQEVINVGPSASIAVEHLPVGFYTLRYLRGAAEKQFAFIKE